METLVKIMKLEQLKKFYQGKRVLVTGHTGFKGSWLCKLLMMLGADVYGYALEAPTNPSLFEILNLKKDIHSQIGDVRNYDKLKAYFDSAKPEVVFHLAAQPIVRDSYKIPREAYETNVMGTVNMLECLRLSADPVSFLNITTDKVYENSDLSGHSFTEDEKLNGYDPYSNSKSCSELITDSYKKSFFHGGNNAVTKISTARAGNVIGGGDFANDRIVPDCIRAVLSGKPVIVRNPYSVRPYQHVLDPLFVYLMIAMKQAEYPDYSGCYNVGPTDADCITTGELADIFVHCWGNNSSWKNLSQENAPHEANFLKLDCSKLAAKFSWSPVWHVNEAISESVKWYKAWAENMEMGSFTEQQIYKFDENQIC